ncbi:CocE/NonD family hydrolase, partial [Stenotrophomonas sp. A3_2]|uniref:CocE/NonD family hydrolase n=1 Tax=Stenotrophomonas sp. A3_2 TaxID=3119978 RepID=UPI002FC31389
MSYDGFTTLMSLFHPHPALVAAVPMNPMVDGWIGDDWFHKGAFRQLGSTNYIYEQQGTRANDEHFWTGHYDDYDAFLEAGPGAALAHANGLQQMGFWRKLEAHPTYDAFWQAQAVDKLLAAEKPKVPILLVHSLWDQEDIYGAPAVWRALKAVGTPELHLVMGPWHHGQGIEDGSTLGALHFGIDSALSFRRQVLRPFLDAYLKDGAPKADIPKVMAFETG